MTFNKNMTPITLAGRGETVDEGTLCNATGWGDLVEDQAEDFPTILQVVSLPLVSRGICNEAVGGITDAMICAGFEEGGTSRIY